MQEVSKKTQNILNAHQLDGLLVTNFYDLLYVAGFAGLSPTEREAVVLLRKTDAHIWIPKLYADKVASLEQRGFEVHFAHRGNTLLEDWVEYESDRVGFASNDLSVVEYESLREEFSGKLVSINHPFREMRISKNADEEAKIRKAVEITDQVMTDTFDYIQNHSDYTQLTERDVAEKLRELAFAYGGDGFSFPPIVAVGPGSAEPHHLTSNNRRLESGQALLIDIGVAYQNYTGDLTRMAHLGPAPDEFKQHYSHVNQARGRAIAAAKPGMTGAQIDAVAREYLQSQKLDELFIHGLGHGVGLEIHEQPYLTPNSRTILESDMMVTIEPGIYLPGKYGIRIEDFVKITDNGCEVLSRTSRELIEII